MFFFKGKQDLGLDASLNLLDLSPIATIDDANQAYTYLHRMIELFHRDNEAAHGDRQEDLELLACAYEKAVSYLSDQNPRPARNEASGAPRPITGDSRPATDLHFTINFSTPEDHDPAADEPLACFDSLSKPDSETIESAIAIISRRLQEAESALGEAQQAVEAASAAVEAANRRLEQTKQDRMNTIIAAKSAKSRALLLEIEVKRATEEAIAVAEKARDRVMAARQAAKEAKAEADLAQDRIHKVTCAQETAAAELVCAEDQLEMAKNRLKALTHAVVDARSRLRVFEGVGGKPETSAAPADLHSLAPMPGDQRVASQGMDDPMDPRQQIMAELLAIETSLSARKRRGIPAAADHSGFMEISGPEAERRQHARLYYPDAQRPMFSFNGRSIPVLDLSQTGLGLEPDTAVGQSHLVRGAIVFNGRPTMNVTGRVVRRDERGVGLRLVTRIGNHILDQERMRLGA
jgi:hypothetical protein